MYLFFFFYRNKQIQLFLLHNIYTSQWKRVSSFAIIENNMLKRKFKKKKKIENRDISFFLDSIYYDLTHLRVRTYTIICVHVRFTVSNLSCAREIQKHRPSKLRAWCEISTRCPNHNADLKARYIRYKNGRNNIDSHVSTNHVMDTNILFEKRLARKSTFG